MKSLVLFWHTDTGKYVKNFIIGVGAGIVLLGALFKLQHWPGAGIMLSVGMFTEVFIFTLLGILPPHKDYYWERYYPDLDQDPHVEAYKKGVKFTKPELPAGLGGGSGSGNTSLTSSFEKMLEEANINKPSLERLSNSFQNFGKTVEDMKDVSGIMAATSSYASATNEAVQELNKLKETYAGAAQTLQSFNEASESTHQFHNQVQVLSKNLGTLNQIYEVELQDANNHLKAMNKFYSNLVNASESMASSADDAVAAKDEIAKLSKNLGALNSIYGNMLSAMQGRQ